MKIGNLNLDNRVFLSPMAGVTDLPFRLICKEQDSFRNRLKYLKLLASENL